MQSHLRTLTLGTVLAIMAPGLSLTAQVTDRAIGSWSLDLAKSKYELTAAPKSLTVTYTLAGKVLTVATKGVDAQGNPTATGYTSAYDGKDVPSTGGTNYDMVSMTQINASTVKITRKKGTTTVATLTRVVSADGKVLTITTVGTNAQGKTAKDIGVFERQ